MDFSRATRERTRREAFGALCFRCSVGLAPCTAGAATVISLVSFMWQSRSRHPRTCEEPDGT